MPCNSLKLFEIERSRIAENEEALARFFSDIVASIPQSAALLVLGQRPTLVHPPQKAVLRSAGAFHPALPLDSHSETACC